VSFSLYVYEKKVCISIKEDKIKENEEEKKRKRKDTQKVITTTSSCCNFKTSRCFPFRSVPLHLEPSRPTHSTLAPYGGSYPGESITDEEAHQRV